MSNINSYSFSGNLTRDSELRVTASGYQILTFSVAVNERRKNKDTGEWENTPNYFDCKMFGGYAESMEPHLIKGVKVAISGKVQQERWEKDGKTNSKVVFIVNELELMGSRGESKPKAAPASVYANEDIPF